MNYLPNDFNNQTTMNIFEQTKTKIRQSGYYFQDCEFKFGKIMTYVSDKQPELRLRCSYSNQKCPAAIHLTREGCIQYLCGVQHTWPHAILTRDHILNNHKEKKPKTLVKARGNYQKVTEDEIDKLILEDGLRQTKIMDILGKRVRKTDVTKVRKQVIQRIAALRGSQTTKNCIETTPDIQLNRQNSPYCRVQVDFQTDDGIGRAIVFGAREQFILLTKSDLIAVDGFFKLHIKGFRQLLTLAVFLNNIYVPVCHILLTDKKTSTYNQAFYQVLALAQNDTQNSVDWTTKTVISDYEKGLSAAITNVLRPGVQNHCYFHYIKAIYDNFIKKVPKKLRNGKKEFLKCLKVHPFTRAVEKSVRCSRELFIAAAFYYHFGRCKEILPFFSYFRSNWAQETHIFREDTKAVQRTTNGVETLHGMYRHKGIVGIGRLDDLIDSLIDSDSSLYDAYIDADLAGRSNNEFAWRSVSGTTIVKETEKVVKKTIEQFKSIFRSHPRFYFDNLGDLEKELERIQEEEQLSEQNEDNLIENDDFDEHDLFTDPEMAIEPQAFDEEEEEEEDSDLMAN